MTLKQTRTTMATATELEVPSAPETFEVEIAADATPAEIRSAQAKRDLLQAQADFAWFAARKRARTLAASNRVAAAQAEKSARAAARSAADAGKAEELKAKAAKLLARAKKATK
jgi:lipopolysaccharide export system protein LptA